LAPVFTDIDQAARQQTYEKGVASGTSSRKPGGGAKGKRPTMAETLPLVLSYYQTYPPFAGLGQQFEMARSQAKAHLHKLSPVLYDTLVHLALTPSRELATPEALQTALQGGERRRIDATERAYHRATEAVKQRAHDRGKKNGIR
jgi:hypothetical protein